MKKLIIIATLLISSVSMAAQVTISSQFNANEIEPHIYSIYCNSDTSGLLPTFFTAKISNLTQIAVSTNTSSHVFVAATYKGIYSSFVSDNINDGLYNTTLQGSTPTFTPGQGESPIGFYFVAVKPVFDDNTIIRPYAIKFNCQNLTGSVVTQVSTTASRLN
jgi:hypothetical protein